MKGVFLLILVCGITSTWQQNLFWRPLLMQDSVDYANLDYFSHPRVKLIYQKKVQNPVVEPKSKESDEIEARRVSGAGFSRPKFNSIQSLAENRAFGFNILAYNYLNNLLPMTVTSTSLSTITTTVTIGTIATCFAKAMFAANIACKRKRDLHTALGMLDDVMDRGKMEDRLTQTFVAPSKVEPLKTTEISSTLPILLSSMDDVDVPEDEGSIDGIVNTARYKRRYSATTTTVTSTMTSIFFYTTTQTKTYDTKFAADGAVKCIPIGFTTC